MFVVNKLNIKKKFLYSLSTFIAMSDIFNMRKMNEQWIYHIYTNDSGMIKN